MTCLLLPQNTCRHAGALRAAHLRPRGTDSRQCWPGQLAGQRLAGMPWCMKGRGKQSTWAVHTHLFLCPKPSPVSSGVCLSLGRGWRSPRGAISPLAIFCRPRVAPGQSLHNRCAAAAVKQPLAEMVPLHSGIADVGGQVVVVNPLDVRAASSCYAKLRSVSGSSMVHGPPRWRQQCLPHSPAPSTDASPGSSCRLRSHSSPLLGRLARLWPRRACITLRGTLAQ